MLADKVRVNIENHYSPELNLMTIYSLLGHSLSLYKPIRLDNASQSTHSIEIGWIIHLSYVFFNQSK